MTEPPAPPPEAQALRAARVGQHLSIREAALRAGVSVTLWRQVEAGYMTPAKGVHTPKIAPAPTLARMARAVNLPAEHLESEGHRPDAAEILRSIPEQPEKTPDTYSNEQQLPPILRDLPTEKLISYLESVDHDMIAAVEGHFVFEDPFQLSILRNEGLSLDAKRLLIAIYRSKIDDARDERAQRDQSA